VSEPNSRGLPPYVHGHAQDPTQYWQPYPTPARRRNSLRVILGSVLAGVVALCLCFGVIGALVDDSGDDSGPIAVADDPTDLSPTPAPRTTAAAPRTTAAAPKPPVTSAAPKPSVTTRRPSPARTTTQPPQTSCDPAYPTVCIRPAPPDLDCGDIPYRKFTVLAPDPHRFDADDDGIGCESG